MESVLTVEIAVASIATLLAMLLGYLGQQGMGAAMLGAGAIAASVLCILGTWLGYELGENTGAWVGLLIGIVLAGVGGARGLGFLIRGRSGRFIVALWFGFCALCIWGYVAGGWVGLVTITLPTIAIFWIGLYRISAHILPLPDKGQRSQAFRCLLTYSLGTNYPYYVARNGKRQDRVPGNPYNQFFAGPGIILAACDQAVYVTDGIKVKGVKGPGVTFTGMFDLPPKVVDLRPQLCAFHVEALTRDGIPIKVLTFVPFRIRQGGREPKLGEPFPFDPQAILEAVAREPVEKRTGQEERKHEWNINLIPMVTTRVVQDIIGRYTVDELCAGDEPDRDPRVEIIRQMKEEVTKAAAPYGIEVLGGGISNLVPADEKVLEGRFEKWQAEWERQVFIEYSQGEADRARQIEKARAEAEAEVILKLSKVVQQSLADGTATQTALALRFIDCLGEMVTRTETQWPAPPALRDTFERLRGKIALERA